MRVAVIENGTVTNIIEADLATIMPPDGQLWVASDAAARGDLYDGAQFSRPVQDMPQPTARWITKLAFHDRFTDAELVVIDLSSIDDPQADMATRQQSAGLRVNLKKVDMAAYIDLDRSDTRAGVQQLETAGLLATGRALEILDAEIQPKELYTG